MSATRASADSSTPARAKSGARRAPATSRSASRSAPAKRSIEPARCRRREYSTSRTSRPASTRAYALEINARVDAGRLIFDIEYSRRLHTASAIERFADALRQALGAIAATQPSSFALAMVDAAALSRVADLLADIDDE